MYIGGLEFFLTSLGHHDCTKGLVVPRAFPAPRPNADLPLPFVNLDAKISIVRLYISMEHHFRAFHPQMQQRLKRQQIPPQIPTKLRWPYR